MSLKIFQQKIGATPDGVFGKETMIKTMKFYKLSKEQVAHFFGQCAHETGHFKLFVENLNYSADGLLKIFGKYFKSNASAIKYARKPEMIANVVYANRMGNGDEASGDGWKHRGRGALQTTGKNNYKLLSDHLKKPEILSNPDLVATEYCFDAAIFYFSKNKLWDNCLTVTTSSITTVSKAVNGGTNGLKDRIALTNKYYNLVK